MLVVMALPEAAMANIVVALPVTASKVDAKLASGVAIRFFVVGNLVGKVEGKVCGLHALPKVVGRGALDGAGIQMFLGTEDKLVVVVKVELKVQLEPHPKVREDTVPPVVGAKDHLRWRVLFLNMVLCPADSCGESKVGIL